MMKLSQITLHNVKSFKESTVVNFNEQFNILIGPNGGGKKKQFAGYCNDRYEAFLVKRLYHRSQ